MQSPLYYQASHYPERPAIIGEWGNFNYQQLALKVVSVMEQLEQMRLPQQSRIGWIAHAPLEGILLQQACLHGGWVFCSVSPHLRGAQLEQALETFELDAIVGNELDLTLPRITLDLQPQAFSFERLNISLDEHQWVDMVLTSGSSGRPKAVIHSWQNLYYSALGSNQLIAFETGDNWLASLPLFHVGGQAIIWRALLAGACITLSQQPLAKTLEQYPISHLSLVPTQLYRLLPEASFNADTLHLRHILVGGGSCNELKLQQAEQRGFRCYMSYGSSEMSSQVATREVGKGVGAGTLLNYRELCFIDGEICLRGKTLSPGYFQQGNIVAIGDEQGWFHSRDNGHWQEDQLIVEGRRDHIFICGGENIQPEAIETTLLSHPDIMSAVVVSQSDKEYGQRPVAFIQYNKIVTRGQLDDYLKPHLSAFKRPVRYYQLPDQSGLKVQRKLVQQWANRPADYSIVEIE